MKDKDHIHTWNSFDKYGHLKCTNCGMIYNKFLQESLEEDQDEPY